nr:Imm1 family immunity protein [Micromonospora narathiwatensis]
MADMMEGWRLQGHHDPLAGDQGQLLAVVTNGTRALVMVLDEPGDAGEHAIDPTATGKQGGYVLSNGQHETYDAQDTVPLEQALVIVEHLIDHGRPPTGVGWHVDR